MFAPLKRNEKEAYFIYPLTNAGIILYPFFLTVKAFASPDKIGLNTDGIYRFSRNPMYVSYFVCFLGMALLTMSPLLLGVVILLQVSGHFIILSEERWCREKFGAAYEEYCLRVRRYI